MPATIQVTTREEREPTAAAQDAALAQRLWELSERMVAR